MELDMLIMRVKFPHEPLRRTARGTLITGTCSKADKRLTILLLQGSGQTILQNTHSRL